MSSSRLLADAQKMVENKERSAARLKQEILDLENQAAAKREELKKAHLASKHLLNFTPVLDGALQCPRCWVERERHSALITIPGTNDEDRFRCQICNYHISIRID